MSHQNSKGGIASVFPYGPEAHHNKPEEHPDTMPSDYQPPGVDEKFDEDISLEEALSTLWKASTVYG